MQLSVRSTQHRAVKPLGQQRVAIHGRLVDYGHNACKKYQGNEDGFWFSKRG